MNFNLENDVLTIFVDGRIDSNNAEGISNEIDSIIAGKTFDTLVIDVDGLEYISSAGLRVILRLKKTYKNFKVINASTDVYDVFDMTGFADIMDIQKGYRKFSVDGLQVIGAGAKGTVYRYNADTIIKVYNDLNALEGIKQERLLAKQAFVLGIPTAISYDVVKVGDKFGSVFEMLDAKSLSQLIKENPENIKQYAKMYADMMKLIHSTETNSDQVPSCKPMVEKWVKRARNYIDANICDKIQQMFDAVPERNNLVHMDYHTNNVLVQNGEALLIDMDTLSKGHPLFDLANVHSSYVTFAYLEGTIEAFMGFGVDVANKLMDYFFDFYFDGYSEQAKKDAITKVEIISNLRNINRMAKQEQTPEVIAVLNRSIKEVIERVEKVDRLDF